MLKRVISVLVWGLVVVGARADDVAKRVVIVANSDDADSLRLADYYAGKRGVPKENIIALPMPKTESVTWRAFVDTMFNPLQAELVEREWIDAIGMDLTDTAGRKKYAMSGHRISYLVTCRGVPLKIANDPQMAEAGQGSGGPAFKTNAAAVDSEFALLAMSGTPLAGIVRNPLFKKDAPSTLELGQVVKVGRLDGPSYDDARRMIDGALEAERTGLIGRSYVDIGGKHKAGDVWLEDVVKQLGALHYDGDVDRERSTLAEWSRMDAPALYFGWYAGSVNGPFLRDGFEFAPGAVALHIHSFSAQTLRSKTKGWAGPFVARGVAATFGNVHEPYLELTHQPHLVLKSLARGDRLGDAAAYALPAYSWQGTALGDPLYRPFKVPFAEQWSKRDKLPPERRAYLVTRRMRELDANGRRGEAIRIGKEFSQKGGFHLAVALTLVELQQAAGDKAGAQKTLEGFTTRRRYSAADAPLAAEAARLLREAGQLKLAVGVWYAILGDRDQPKDVRVRWLRRAIDAARAAQDERQALRWDEELKVLTAPPPEAAE